MNRQSAERCRRAGTRTLLYPKEQALDQTEEGGEEEKAFLMRQATTIDDNQYVTDLNRKLRYNATCDELQAKHNKRSQDPFNRNIMHRNARARALVRNSFSDQKLQAKRRMQGHALLCL
jgi:hypothetical protein